MEAGRCWRDYENGVWWWDAGGCPMPVTHCIGCGMPLPRLDRIVPRVVRDDTPWDQADGG